MLVAASGGVWNSELAKDRHEPVHWLWDGMLAPGAMTLLTGSWKAGKSTLVSLLLDRRRDGGQLLGRTRFGIGRRREYGWITAIDSFATECEPAFHVAAQMIGFIQAIHA